MWFCLKPQHPKTTNQYPIPAGIDINKEEYTTTWAQLANPKHTNTPRKKISIRTQQSKHTQFQCQLKLLNYVVKSTHGKAPEELQVPNVHVVWMEQIGLRQRIRRFKRRRWTNGGHAVGPLRSWKEL